MVAYSCRLASVLFWFLTHCVLCLCLLRFSLLRGLLHSFCYWLLLFVQALFCLLSFVFVAFLRSCALALLRSFAGLKRLLLGNGATILFVVVSCCEPGDGNEQMAHSQIVVVIAFS